ncbi:MAG: hypothetical protein Q9227_006712 [Pyrenula ochraceoflavens]
MRTQITCCLAAVFASIPAIALPQNHTDDQVNAPINAGTFQNPSVNVRPRFRYWVPDASVDGVALAADVKEAGRVGAGGVEVLGYYLYGGTPQGTGTFAPDDWSVYGWGTPEWQDAFRTLARAHDDNGLIMDFALGPNQGQGVPAPQDSDGLMWDLWSYNISIPIGGAFDGILPGWGTGPLQAVVTGLAISLENITVAPSVITSLNGTGVPPSLPGDPPFNRTQVTLSLDSLKEVTDQVSSDGHLNLQFPSNTTGLEYQLFAIYLIHSEYRAQADPVDVQGPQTEPQNYLQNGSWAVDHFSALGAQTVTDFWEQYVLINGTRELLERVGNYGWEDSIELRANLMWTKNLPQTFSANHGYDLTKWLPIMFHQNKIGFDVEPTIWWITDEPDAGNSHIADYRETLGNLYGLYLQVFNDWANDYLNLQFSAQPSYNLPMDMLQNVPNVNAPECESLGFNHLVDGYRQFTGPANLAGKRVISTECGANRGEVYQQTIPELLWDVKRSIAGSYGNTTWPGFTTFNYQYSEMHGPRQPDWEFISDAMNFTARLSYIFQSGVPKIDLAFYKKTTIFNEIIRDYQPADLEEAGFSYEYISPDNFNLSTAYVENSTFAPDRQSFKAMIVRANDSMTTLGVSKIAEYAHAGLPIIFSGGIPNNLLTTPEPSDSYVTDTLQPLTSLPNVHVVPYENIASSISSLGLTPLTVISANTTWYTYWRNDAANSIDYIFVYNDAAELSPEESYSEGTIEFATTGIPYHFDAWTGAQTPILQYNQSSTSTTIPLALAGNQSTIIAFSSSPLDTSPIPPVHVTSPLFPIIPLSYTPPTTAKNNSSDNNGSGGLIANLPPSTPPTTLTLSSNTTCPLPSTPSTPSNTLLLTNWSLTIESWLPPTTLSSTPFHPLKRNTTYPFPLSTPLPPWPQLDPALANTSGIGYYRTTFPSPPFFPSSSSTNNPDDGDSKDIVMLRFKSPIQHTLRLSINSHPVPPLDPTNPLTDITPYLSSTQQNSENEVLATVSTPLGNALRPIWNELRSSGEAPDAQDVPESGGRGYGVVGEVWVEVWKGVKIKVGGGF